ncbi:MAG: DUF1553 domain-containing protein, partial [Planctomycetota bacterium]|nr:DUF1553 domain-containing protein [Planctomycetota bacterium]
YNAAGTIVWAYDIPLFGKPKRGGHGLDSWGNHTFAAIRLPNGNTLISTGNGHSVLEVTPEKEIVWHLKQDDLPGIRLAWVTTVEVLPNGNYVIGNCHAGPDNPQIIEITREKEVVWTFKDFKNFGNSLSNSTLIDVHEDELFYRREVQPILAKNCYKCHGDRERKIKGGLWLRARHNILQGGQSGRVVDLLEPERSRLLALIRHEEAERPMPPKKKLAAAEIDTLTRWIGKGLPMSIVEDEWIYEKPNIVTTDSKSFWSFQPKTEPTPPAVKDQEWCRNEIDHFVLARIEDAGLRPAKETDRISFIRRASYDLTGLPPTIEEINAFVTDRTPEAHQTLIDRLLHSPHYGEHWGRHWLDLVRFAETNGYERDNPKPEVWKYRQYVIEAHNKDKPYDRFVLEQLAGDELEDRNAESITATGYYRLGLWDDEPADREQALYDGLDDIVRTTSEVFLGLTVGCARCHDHKIDPIPQTDYYRMLAFFRQIEPYSGNTKMILTDISTAAEQAEIGQRNTEIHKQRVDLNRRINALHDRFKALYRRETSGNLQLSPISDLRFSFYRDTWDKLPDFDGLKAETEGLVPSNLFDIGLASRNSAFGFVFRGKLTVPSNGQYIFFLDSDDGARLSIDGREIILYDGIHGLGKNNRVPIELSEGRHDIQLDYFQAHGGLGLRVSWSGPGFKKQTLSAPDEKNKDQRLEQMLKEHGRRLLGKDASTELRDLKKSLAGLKDVKGTRFVLSVKERKGPPPKTHVLIRGNPHSPAQEVEPGFPEILASSPPKIETRAESSGRRLALARWLTAPENPLTARVMANRIWQFHFGRGIVRSSSNFGTQGRAPTHPGLLDWLAQRFIADGWSLKSLHRRIMLSAAYRMSSTAAAEGLRKDPNNDLLWRFTMRRLSAEELRDSILLITGNMSPAIGGPSVYPAIAKEVLMGQSRNKWPGNDSPANNTRRSIYTFTRRSLMDPFVESFDAATTDTSCPVRFQTTQPTQALTLLNSRFSNLAASALAQRLRKEAGEDPRRQVALAWQLATGRKATEEQIERGVTFLKSFPEPSSADQALTQWSLIILNLNPFIFLD